MRHVAPSKTHFRWEPLKQWLLNLCGFDCRTHAWSDVWPYWCMTSMINSDGVCARFCDKKCLIQYCTFIFHSILFIPLPCSIIFHFILFHSTVLFYFISLHSIPFHFVWFYFSYYLIFPFSVALLFLSLLFLSFPFFPFPTFLHLFFVLFIIVARLLQTTRS